MAQPGFATRYGPWAIVAGASEGIGAAFSRALAARGVNLVLLARRRAPLEALAAELVAAADVEVVVDTVDLGALDLGERVAAIVGARDVGLLVYNACYSVIAEYLDLSLHDKQKTIDVNCRGPVVLTSALGPRFSRRGRGGIILMSSMSGFQGTAMVGIYAATKAFNTVLGEALWEELGRDGVDVLVCAAGATSTPNFQAQTPSRRQRSAFPMKPEVVVADALSRLGSGRPTWIPGRVNRWVHHALRLVPRARAVKFFSRNTRRIYQERAK